MTIRPMTTDDYDAMHRLWTTTPGMGLRSLDDGPEGIAQFLARNPDTCFVAEEDSELLGTVLCGHDGRRAYVYHLTVAPQARKRGLGRALVAAAEDALRAIGIHKTALVVFADNAGGNAFWQALGYEARADLIYRNKSLNDGNR